MEAKRRPFATLRIAQFRNLMLGRLFLVLSFRMLATLLGWWVYALTNDPLAIGIIGLSEVLPAVLSALYAGHVIDTSEKKKLLLLCNFGYILLVGLLAFLAYAQEGQHLFENRTVTYFIYGLVFFTGICRAFLGPLIPAMIPKIVGMDQLPAAITVNQATFLSASVTGHALGGFLIGLIGIPNTLAAIVGCMAVAFLLFLSLGRHPGVAAAGTPVLAGIREGLNYIRNTREILGALMLDMFAVLFGGAVAMIPVFARSILHVGSEGFGLLNAASDIGSVIIILFLGFFPLKGKQGIILIVAVALFGLSIIGFGASRMYALSFIFLVISGIVDGISVVIRGTIVQLKTPEEIRGRVLSVNSIFIMSSNELGQFESGLAAKLLGPVRSVIFGGSMTVLIALLVGLKFPKLRRMEY